jgi:hypothetical protein
LISKETVSVIPDRKQMANLVHGGDQSALRREPVVLGGLEDGNCALLGLLFQYAWARLLLGMRTKTW